MSNLDETKTLNMMVDVVVVVRDDSEEEGAKIHQNVKHN